MYNKKRQKVLNESIVLSVTVSLAVTVFPPLILSYILFKHSKLNENLTNRINNILKDSKINWQVRVLSTKVVNALSTGDVRIYITKGCLDLLDEDEAVAVCLHEIAHSKYLHIPANVAQHLGANFLMNKLDKMIKKHLTTKAVELSLQGSKFGISLLKGISAWWFEPIMFLLSLLLMVYSFRIPSYYKEKQADMFAVKLGFGGEISSALLKITNSKRSDEVKRSIFGPFLKIVGIINKHPTLEERLAYCLDDDEIKNDVKNNDKNSAIKRAVEILRGKQQ